MSNTLDIAGPVFPWFVMPSRPDPDDDDAVDAAIEATEAAARQLLTDIDDLLDDVADIIGSR